MQDFQEFFTNAFSGFGITDAVDIILVTFVVYYLLKLILETRAAQIIKGILVLVGVTLLSEVLELHTLNWMCKGALTLGAVALLIVLQPELRRALEFMGRGRIVSGLGQGDKENSKRIVTAVTNAVAKFSSTRTGALIVFERQTMLEDYPGKSDEILFLGRIYSAYSYDDVMAGEFGEYFSTELVLDRKISFPDLRVIPSGQYAVMYVSDIRENAYKYIPQMIEQIYRAGKAPDGNLRVAFSIGYAFTAKEEKAKIMVKVK